MSTTPFFSITFPGAGQTSYYGDLAAFFLGVETTIGQNCHLILTGDSNVTAQYELGYFSDGEHVNQAKPSDGHWGRIVAMVETEEDVESLTRLLGITPITGVSGSLGTPIFHDAGGSTVTINPVSAVVSVSGRIFFLPLGMSLGAGVAFFTGLMPLQVCPIVLAGSMFIYKDGSNNPTVTSIATVYASGVWVYQAQFDGATQDIDAIFQIQVPADFGSFPDKTGAAFWGIRTRFQRHDNSTTGYAGGQVVGFVDTSGTEFTSLGTSLEQAGAWADQVVSWHTLAGLSPTMTPGGTCFVRLKLRGNNGDYVDFETPSLQYFPAIEWT